MLKARQRGAVLAMSLVVLVVMTLLVLTMLKTNVLELKIGGITQAAEQNFANADLAVIKFINDNKGNFSMGCTTPGSSMPCTCTNPDPARCHEENVGGNKTSYAGGSMVRIGDRSADQGIYGAQKTDITVQELTGCLPYARRGTDMESCDPLNPPCIQTLYLNVQAVSKGSAGGEATINQGLESFCK